jgi:hypothetical protein
MNWLLQRVYIYKKQCRNDRNKYMAVKEVYGLYTKEIIVFG